MKAKRKAATAFKRSIAEHEKGEICQKCLEPALPGKRLCKRHYEIVMTYAVPKANEATRKILADARENNREVHWAAFKKHVMWKREG